MNETAHTTSPHGGFTLVEVVLVVLLMAICLVPMMNALMPAHTSAGVEEETTVCLNQARGTLNRVLCLDFAVLSPFAGQSADLDTLLGAGTGTAEETFAFNGNQYTPTVHIEDASGGTGGLLRVSVTVDTVTLTTLRADY